MDTIELAPMKGWASFTRRTLEAREQGRHQLEMYFVYLHAINCDLDEIVTMRDGTVFLR